MSLHISDSNFDVFQLNDIGYLHFECEDMSVNDSDKKYIECDKECPCVNPKYGYIQLFTKQNPNIKICTPIMVCPFGFNKNTHNMSLQFTNYKSDQEMKSFYDFIQQLEFLQMKILGLKEQDMDKYISQIKHDKSNKYDPNLLVKIPFNYNKFEADIYSESYSGVSIMNINRFTKLRCEIYLDKIWKTGDVFVSKWKVSLVNIV